MTVKTYNFDVTENPLNATYWGVVQGCVSQAAAGGVCIDQAAGTNANYWSADSFGNNQYSQAKIRIPSNAYWFIFVRYTEGASAHNFYYITRNTSGSTWVLGKNINGESTQLGSEHSHTYADGDLVKIQASSTTITGWMGSDTAEETDSSLSSGSTGLAQARFYTVWFDDWEGGDLGAEADLSISVSECVGSEGMFG